MRSTAHSLLAGVFAFLMAACEQPNPVGPGELASSDALIVALEAPKPYCCPLEAVRGRPFGHR